MFAWNIQRRYTTYASISSVCYLKDVQTVEPNGGTRGTLDEHAQLGGLQRKVRQQWSFLL